MFDRPPRYRAYLLTLWEERGRDAGPSELWRFRLEDPRTGKWRGFVSLEELLAAIERDMADSHPGESTEER